MQDDPVCVAARKAGKKVVVDQWVEDSFELGELADADRVSLTSLPAFYATAVLTFRICLVPRNLEELESNLIMKWEALSRYWFQFMGSEQALVFFLPNNKLVVFRGVPVSISVLSP